MIVQFSINPMDTEHFSADIAAITAVLEEAGVDYALGPIGTSLKGDWETLLPLIQKCHQMAAARHARVLTQITIDDHKGKEHTLSGAIKAAHSPVSHMVRKPNFDVDAHESCNF